MAHGLLAYMSEEVVDADVDALKSLAEKLEREGHWSRQAPCFVDELDGDSCTAPGDEPIRTVGMLFVVSGRDESPVTPVAEAERFVDALARFSEARGVEFELQLDETYVGLIRGGVADRLLREGLLARW